MKIIIKKGALFSSLFCFFIATFAAKIHLTDNPKYEFIPRGILIFLDDSEERGKNDAIHGSFTTAVKHITGPLIVSARVISNAKDDIKEQLKSYIIKEINPNRLYLFLPKVFLTSIGINPDQVHEYDKSKISDAELLLGLKINHMQTVNIDSIGTTPYRYDHASYFINSLIDIQIEDDPDYGHKYIPTGTSSIFCTKPDYKDKNLPIPSWAIYISGHGSMHNKIVYLSLDDFKKFLNFLENNINTKLLVYSSCYASGVNAENIYGSQKKFLAKTYQFPIITEALTDSPIYFTPANQTFGDFLREITKEVIDYKEAMLRLRTIPFSETFTTASQIKLPGVEWFSVMKVDEFIAQIGSILAQTRDPNKPLYIVKFFKSEPHAILLYTEIIPFELIINSKKMGAIISMIPGDVTHKIKEISSDKHNPNEIIQWFMSIYKLDPLKIFFIEKIGAYKNIIVYKGQPSVLSGEYETYAIFQDGEETKMINKKATEIIVGGQRVFEFEQTSPGPVRKNMYTAILSNIKRMGKDPFDIKSESAKAIEQALRKQPQTELTVGLNNLKKSVILLRTKLNLLQDRLTTLKISMKII